jgi:hypothetical protein
MENSAVLMSSSVMGRLIANLEASEMMLGYIWLTGPERGG